MFHANLSWFHRISCLYKSMHICLMLPIVTKAKLIKANIRIRMKASFFSPFAVAVVVLAVVVASGLRAAEATIESTCHAAAARDRRVDVRFCARQFAAYHGAAEADAWGLAKTAALIGVNLSDDAAYDIGNGKIRPPPAGGARAKGAMAECATAYDAVGLAFAEASDELGSRRYAAAREKLARVAALSQRCDGGLARAGIGTPPALARYSADCQQMAVIGVAITNLIK
ncbi:pectinesterase inhibitor 8-like [Phragmites australis]|uniref:pectinesterase inhibitor 8-like n=1 Tax=Phragmites australis TaxID=29695 RepID=UPI002D77BFD9|nr:pectinesterase inhibitor 8-like [Phragmites australis]